MVTGAEGLGLEGFVLVVILATLAALVYAMKVLILLERRISKIDIHIEKMAQAILNEEVKIEKRVGLKKKRK